MGDEPLFIKPNVRIEGLVNRFVAWLHTFAPVPAAMNLSNLQLPMLDSYIQHPDVHRAAVANPKMKGGFFLDIAPEREGEIKDLRDDIARNNKQLVELASAIADADQLLRTQATGYDLTPLYEQLPEALRGFVELVYDINNHPSLRFIEPLLYRGDAYLPATQSVQLSLDDGTEPPFILSTPRLPAPGTLDLPLPLCHEGIDTLFATRTAPRPFREIREALEISSDADAELLRGLLTDDPGLAPDRHIDSAGSGGRIRYFGHACLLLQGPSTSIIVDPFLSSHHTAGDRFTYQDLPDHIDYCLITHGHQDHIVLETLLQLRHKIGAVVVPRSGGGHRQDPSPRLALRQLGFDVIEVDDFDELSIPDGRIVATPFMGEHCDLDIRAKSTYWVHIAGKAIFVGADTAGVEEDVYRGIRQAVGRTDIAFLGMECDGAPLTWLYNSLFTQPVPRRMSLTRKLSGSNAAQASGIVDHLGASEAYVYAMGEEPWLQHVMATSYTPESYQLLQVAEFLDTCAARDITAEHLLNRKELTW